MGRGSRLFVVGAMLGVAACGGDDSSVPGSPDAAAIDASTIDAGDNCAAVAADPDDYETLADTGLYCDPVAETLAPGVRPFAPEYVLWTDTATKRRWVQLPEGETIDTTDMDFWQFPVGTKFWKEFTRDGVRVETRLLERTGPLDGEWEYQTFAWNMDGTVATNTDGQPVENALGTNHDIPDMFGCINCHNRITSKALGFAAIQLDHSPGGDNVTLDTLVTEGLLSNPPTKDAAAEEYFPLPGSPAAVAATGYLHGNCGGCHFTGSSVGNGFFMRHEVANLGSIDVTPVYTSGVGITATNQALGTVRLDPMNTANSAALLRMQSRMPGQQMPPLGTEDVDTLGGVTLVTDWIDELPVP